MILSDKDLMVWALVISTDEATLMAKADITELRRAIESLGGIEQGEELASLKISVLGHLNNMQANINNIRGWCNG